MIYAYLFEQSMLHENKLMKIPLFVFYVCFLCTDYPLRNAHLNQMFKKGKGKVITNFFAKIHFLCVVLLSYLFILISSIMMNGY